MSDDNQLTPKQLAKRWNLSLITLAKWRWNGYPPEFIKTGRKVNYPLHEVEDFEKKHKAANTSQYGSMILAQNKKATGSR